jgi:hypothetical protein
MFSKRPSPFSDEWLIKQRDDLEKRLARSEDLTASETIRQKLDDIALTCSDGQYPRNWSHRNEPDERQ